VNAEYQGKIQELTEANDDIENFIRSTEIGTIFFDHDLSIRRFTPAFARVTGLVSSDVGRQAATFANPVLVAVVENAPQIRDRGGSHEQVLKIEGRGEFLLRLQAYRQDLSGMEGWIASLVDVGRIRDAEKELKATLMTVDVGICVTDELGRFVEVNPAYCRIYGFTREELIGKSFCMVVPPEQRAAAQEMHDEFLETGREMPAKWQVVQKQGQRIEVAVRASLLRKHDGSRRKITVVSRLDEAHPAIPDPGPEEV
jgi:two-component system CheB/CheR fusion protein